MGCWRADSPGCAASSAAVVAADTDELVLATGRAVEAPTMKRGATSVPRRAALTSARAESPTEKLLTGAGG